MDNKSYSKTSLKNRIKVIINHLQLELQTNSTLDKMEEYKYSVFGLLERELFFQEVGEREESSLVKKVLDEKKLQYFNEFSYNVDKLVIYRNFLIIMSFVQTITNNNNQGIKDKKIQDFFKLNITPRIPFENNNKTKKLITKQILKEKILVDKERNTWDIDSLLSKYIREIFPFLNIEITLSSLNHSDERNKFIYSLLPLSSLHFEESMSLFLEVLDNTSFGQNIPTSMSTFLRYYIYNDKRNVEKEERRNNFKSLYVGGVGSTHLISKLVSDSLSKTDDGFGRKLNIFLDDENKYSKEIRQIHYRMITSEYSEFTNIDESDILTSSIPDNSIDVCISIPQKTLNTLQNDILLQYPKHNVDRYINNNPLPTKNISSFVHYYNTTKLMKHKGYMIVPISFITLLNQSDNKSLHDDVRTRFNETDLYNKSLIEIIKERLIKKVLLLPPKMFTHTQEQCVLLELTSTKNEGINFSQLVDKFLKIKNYKPTLNLKFEQKIKTIFDHYNQDDLYVDKNGEIVDNTSKSNNLVSKYITYNDIENNYNFNILPMYHLQQLSTNNTQKNDFKIIKLQRLNTQIGTNKVKYISQSVFSTYGITNTSQLEDSKMILYKTNYNKYLIQSGDILIYETFKGKKDLTYVEMEDECLLLGNHNLFVLRSKDKDTSKKLFMYLYSNEGQTLLKSLVRSNSKKEVLTVESLKNIVWKDTKDLSDFKQIQKNILDIEKRQRKLFERDRS